jgi:hypothetical protein
MTPIGQITLPITIGTWENFYTENLQFEVANFEMAYNTFLGQLTLSKFLAIPHYAYMVLKMSGPRGVISIRGDVKRTFDCDRESYETTNRLTTSAELQDLNQALAESPSPPPPPDLVMPKAKTSKTSVQMEDSLRKAIPLSTEEPSKVAHVCNNLDPK